MRLVDFVHGLSCDSANPPQTRIRWAIRPRRTSRLPVDGSRRYDFGAGHTAESASHFSTRQGGPCR